MEVYDGKLVVMESGNRSALFSLETGTLLSDYTIRIFPRSETVTP